MTTKILYSVKKLIHPAYFLCSVKNNSQRFTAFTAKRCKKYAMKIIIFHRISPHFLRNFANKPRPGMASFLTLKHSTKYCRHEFSQFNFINQYTNALNFGLFHRFKTNHLLMLARSAKFWVKFTLCLFACLISCLFVCLP